MGDFALKPMFERLCAPRAIVVRMPGPDGSLGPSTVKVVAVNPDLQSIVYKSAWVGDHEDVQVGDQETYAIGDMGDIILDDSTRFLTIAKNNGDVFMQLQMESEEEASQWRIGLTLLKQFAASTDSEYETAQAERDENLQALLSLREDIDQMQQRLVEVQDEQERSDEEPSNDEPHEEPQSNQLPADEQPTDAQKIEQQARQMLVLMEVNKQKETTIQRLTQRLEHSLEMLKAVHDMYDQQKNVVQQQQRVIEEFRAERDAQRGAVVVHASKAAQPTSVATPPGPVKSVRPPQQVATGQGREKNARERLQKLEEQGQVPQYQQLVDIEAMIGANGEPTLDSMDDLLTLLKQVETLKKSIDGLERMTGSPGTKDESDDDQDTSDDNMPALQKPTSDEDSAEELQFLGKNLRSLEAEKQAMQNELRAAQDEQEEMVKRLGEMKAMMEALSALPRQ